MATKAVHKQAGTAQRGTNANNTDIFYDSTADALKVVNNAGSAVTLLSSGSEFTLAGTETVTGAHTFQGAQVHEGAETHAGAEEHTGIETHTGAETHAGAEEHTGVETHTGAETHSGAEVFSGAVSGLAVAKTVTFTCNGTNTTHTGTVVIPAGATLLDIRIQSSALWSGPATAAISVGDAQAATGWFNAISLKATDLLVGEVLSISNSENWGGKQGAYLVAATGVKGQATATKAGCYYVTAGSVIGVVSVGTPSGVTGETYMTVVYAVGTVVAPVLT